MTNEIKQIALDFHNRINSGDVAGAAAMLAEDLVNHAAVPEAQGRKGFETIQGKIRTAFPDVRFNLADTLVDGDKVLLRVDVTATHKGPLSLRPGTSYAATGAAVKFEQMHVLRIAGGKIVEHWMTMDSVALYRQLGLKVVQA
jgi:predicted ester cyclase